MDEEAAVLAARCPFCGKRPRVYSWAGLFLPASGYFTRVYCEGEEYGVERHYITYLGRGNSREQAMADALKGWNEAVVGERTKTDGCVGETR
jgi:hypothetical protein